MKYVLKDGVELCAYQMIPYAIKKYEKVRGIQVVFIDKLKFDMLSLCDGQVDFDLPLFNDEQKKVLSKLKDENFIEESNTQKKVKYTYYDNRFIRSIYWSITGKCNLKCKHCYISAPDAKYGELCKEAIFKIIDEMVECGIFNVSLSGGECLVREDFFEIVDKLLENNIFIDSIYTNGCLVNEKLLNELKKRNICPRFVMSFDGVGYHDYMRGVDGAEKMVDNAFNICHEMGFPTGAEMCLFDKNKWSIRKSVNYLAGLHVKLLKIAPVYDTIYWRKYGDGKTFSPKELFDIYLEYIPHYYEDNKPIDLMLSPLFYARKDEDKYAVIGYKKTCKLEDTYACCSARNTMSISADGRAVPCIPLCNVDIEKKFPFVTEIGLKKCLLDTYYMEFISTTAKEIIDSNEECKNCEYKCNCLGGCRAFAYAADKNLYGKDPSLCFLFKNGYIEKVKEAVATKSNDKIFL